MKKKNEKVLFQEKLGDKFSSVHFEVWRKVLRKDTSTHTECPATAFIQSSAENVKLKPKKNHRRH